MASICTGNHKIEQYPRHKLAKICFGHMIKMADMSIYGKKPLKPSSPEPEG